MKNTEKTRPQSAIVRRVFKVVGASDAIVLFLRICLLLAVIVPAQWDAAAQGRSATDLYDMGRKAQDAQEYREAIDAYKSALALNPKYGESLAGLAGCFYLIDEYGEALKYVTEAKKYDRENLSLYTLEGSIRAALGEYEAARGIFESVLLKEPNNLDARFGLAELDLSDGKAKQAAKRYLDTLGVSPLNKTSLLSLVRLYSGFGDSATAASYLELATKYYSNDPAVHFTAGSYYDSIKNPKLATFHYRTALDLNPQYYDAALSLAVLYYKQGNPADAIVTAKAALDSDSTLVKYRGRYLLGLFSGQAGNTAESMKNFNAALKLRNDDEISRIALETLALSGLDETDPARRDLARYHFNNGKLFERNSYLSTALLEYRRALQIDPHYQDARYAYGYVQKLQGYPLVYFFNLLLLKDYYKSQDKRVLDDFDLQLKKYNESVSGKWDDKLIEAIGTDTGAVLDAQPEATPQAGKAGSAKFFNQFTIKKNPFTLALYTVQSANSLVHTDADRILVSYFKDALSRSDKISIPESGIAGKFPDDAAVVFSKAEANRKALTGKTDYYAICAFTELDRSFEISCTLYKTKTGSEIKTFNAYRTGNGRITYALAKCALDIDTAMPVRGSIILRELSNAIVDLGRMQGLKKDDTLVIVKQGGTFPDNSLLALSYDEKNVIGEYKVMEADENISYGAVTRKGAYDFINAGDEVLFVRKTGDAEATR